MSYLDKVKGGEGKRMGADTESEMEKERTIGGGEILGGRNGDEDELGGGEGGIG